MTVVFLDRDGVINANRDDYVKTTDEFVLLPGAPESLARLKEAGITAIVISNQAGIGRGLIDPAELERINRKMLDAVEAHGGEIAGLYYCIHRRDEGCDCRKPGIGLFRAASREMDFELAGSYFVGDAQTDVEAGHRAGLRTVLVLSGKSAPEDVEGWQHKPEHVAPNLTAAVDWILADIEAGG